MAIWLVILSLVLGSLLLFRSRESWQPNYTRESNYYTIRVLTDGKARLLFLDRLLHSYLVPDEPLVLKYDYLKIFADIIKYGALENQTPRVLHLGGGGYSLPRYVEAVYPGSTNDVVEIDPMVTEVAHEYLGLPWNTAIRTYNEDARLFLMKRQSPERYDIVVGDVFNDVATPYHLTTLEFARLVKSNMADGGVYLVNIVDDYQHGRYLPSFIYTLRHAFEHVYLFAVDKDSEVSGLSTFVIMATDQPVDVNHYRSIMGEGDEAALSGYPHDEAGLDEYLAKRDFILLTDDHVPTDIFVARTRR